MRFTYHAPVSEERLSEFIRGIQGNNRKSNQRAVKSALKAVIFGVAARAVRDHGRARR